MRLNSSTISHLNYQNYFIKMQFTLFTLLITLILTSSNVSSHSDNNNIQQPPSIFKGPGYEQLFQVARDQGSDKSDKPFSLECESK